MSTAFLQARDLHAHYGQSHILHGISLAIARGEAVGLLGRNGMGKTTLIRTLMGYVRPAQGRVQCDGREVAGLPPEIRADAGVQAAYLGEEAH